MDLIYDPFYYQEILRLSTKTFYRAWSEEKQSSLHLRFPHKYRKPGAGIFSESRLGRDILALSQDTDKGPKSRSDRSHGGRRERSEKNMPDNAETDYPFMTDENGI